MSQREVIYFSSFIWKMFTSGEKGKEADFSSGALSLEPESISNQSTDLAQMGLLPKVSIFFEDFQLSKTLFS